MRNSMFLHWFQAGVANFIISLTHQCSSDLAPYAGKLLSAMLNGLNDRNITVKKSYASAIGHLVKVWLTYLLKSVHFSSLDFVFREMLVFWFRILWVSFPCSRLLKTAVLRNWSPDWRSGTLRRKVRNLNLSNSRWSCFCVQSIRLVSPRNDRWCVLLTKHQNSQLNWSLFCTDESVREACGVTIHAINARSPDVLKRHAALALPIAFLAMHQNKKESTCAWGGRSVIPATNSATLWDNETTWVYHFRGQHGSDNVSMEGSLAGRHSRFVCALAAIAQCENVTGMWCRTFDVLFAFPGTEGGIRLYLQELVAITKLALDSQSWHMKAQGAAAMNTIATELGSSLGPPHLGLLLDALLAGLSGRTWTGKEALLTALSSVCVSCKWVPRFLYRSRWAASVAFWNLIGVLGTPAEDFDVLNSAHSGRSTERLEWATGISSVAIKSEIVEWEWWVRFWSKFVVQRLFVVFWVSSNIQGVWRTKLNNCEYGCWNWKMGLFWDIWMEKWTIPRQYDKVHV